VGVSVMMFVIVFGCLVMFVIVFCLWCLVCVNFYVSCVKQTFFIKLQMYEKG
jgi:hypothetical protein